MIPAIIIAVLFLGYIVFIQIFLFRDNPKLFSRAVKRYQRVDKKEPPTPGCIVCTGSSVMKYWKTIGTDLAPLPVINRGIAGTKINEIVYWADELAGRYNPSAVVIYAGSNDISGRMPRTPEQVVNGFSNLVVKLRNAVANVQVFYISINPTPAKIRWKHRDLIHEANERIKSFCMKDDRLTFIDITGDFLNEQNQPRREYFRMDQVHLNAKGYEAWTRNIKPVLENWYKSLL